MWQRYFGSELQLGFGVNTMKWIVRTISSGSCGEKYGLRSACFGEYKIGSLRYSAFFLAVVIMTWTTLHGSATTFGAASSPTVKNQSPPINAQDLSRIFRRIHHRLKNAIVEIKAIGIVKTVRKVTTTTSRRLLGHRRPVSTISTKTVTTVVTTTNVGSGIIFSPKGYIVTNAHVVFNAKTIEVILADKRHYPAQLIGAAPQADIAVLKISAPFLTSAVFGNSSRLHVGQWVLDFGAPFRFPESMTQGIISALHRRNNHVKSAEDPQVKLLSHENFIQVDSAFDPGSSGGALVNLRGQVVGVNESIKSGGSGSFSGVGFVIPSHEVVFVIHQLVTTGTVAHGSLGAHVTETSVIIHSRDKQTLRTGLRIDAISPGSSAENAGLKIGDLIVGLNGSVVDRVAQLRNRVFFTAPGKTMVVSLWRGGKLLKITFRVGHGKSSASTTKPRSR